MGIAGNGVVSIRIPLVYASILTFIFIALAVRVVRYRFSNRVSLGDGGHSPLNMAIRTHANFAEYVPLALILLIGLESLQYPAFLIHGLGGLLVLGRISHIYGMSRKNSVGWGRSVGVVLTMAMMIISGVLILVRAL